MFICLREYWREHSANSLIVACRTANPTSFLRCVVGSAFLLSVTDIFWRLAIPTTDNVWGDRLSRTRDSTVWHLAPTFFGTLRSLYGPHVVGRFPTLLAAPPASAAPESVRGPAVTNPSDWRWTRAKHWVQPRFKTIPLVLDLLKQQQMTATVFVPVWRAKPWWQTAISRAKTVCYLSRRAGVPFRGASEAQSSRPHWRECAVQFTFGGRVSPQRPGQARKRHLVNRSLAAAPARRLPRRCLQQAERGAPITLWEGERHSPPPPPGRGERGTHVAIHGPYRWATCCQYPVTLLLSYAHPPLPAHDRVAVSTES